MALKSHVLTARLLSKNCRRPAESGCQRLILLEGIGLNEKVLMTAREVAFLALGECRRNNTWAGAALASLFEKHSISPLETALSTHIVNGVLQNMALCDFYANRFSTIELKKIQPRVLDIIRLSIYQITFLSKIPHSAAVNEGVALAKKYSNPRAAGFVNAVLRKVAQAVSDASLPEPAGGVLERLSILYSHPEWLVRELCDILGHEGAKAALIANNASDTPATAQVNTLLAGADEVLHMLHASGVEASRHKWLEDSIELRGTGDITRLDAFEKGYIYIQDMASRLAVIAAGPKKGDHVIDGCAAPGGKSFAAAIAMENSGRITAIDINASKLELVEKSADRLGIGIIDAVKMDASAPEAGLICMADVVLADVPCSGFGVIRKKPEIRYKSEPDTVGLPDIQKRILSALSEYVKPGGVLMYSTCTVLKRENEDIIKWFLSENGQFSTEVFSLPGVGEVQGGMTTLWPHIHGTDGFFICKLKKCKV
jgi:16S rRNA (cytosine967-C5)-methyltransferase